MSKSKVLSVVLLVGLMVFTSVGTSWAGWQDPDTGLVTVVCEDCAGNRIEVTGTKPDEIPDCPAGYGYVPKPNSRWADYSLELFPSENGALRFPVTWTGRNNIDINYKILGKGWGIPFPTGLQYEQDSETYFQVRLGNNMEKFHYSGGAWVPDREGNSRAGQGANTALDTSGYSVVYRRQAEPGGAQEIKFDPGNYVWVPDTITDTDGRVTEFEWVRKYLPKAITQNVDGQDRRVSVGTFKQLDGGGLGSGTGDIFAQLNYVAVAVLSVKDDGDSWDGGDYPIEAESSQHIRRALFTYFNGYLVAIEIQQPLVAAPSGTGVWDWETVQTYAFRYQHDTGWLEMVFEPAFYAKYVNSNDYDDTKGEGWKTLCGFADGVSDAVAAQYASYAWTYDSKGSDQVETVRTKSGRNCGGVGTASDMSLELSEASNTPAGNDPYNEWTKRRVIDFRDSNGDVIKRVTMYNNFFEAPIFRMVEEGDDIETNGYDIRQADFYVYDGDGRLIMHAENSALDWDAIDAYDSNGGLPSLVGDYDDVLNKRSAGEYEYVEDTVGVVHHRTYGSSTTADRTWSAPNWVDVPGDAHGYVKEIKIQVGDGGTGDTTSPVLLTDYLYVPNVSSSSTSLGTFVVQRERRYLEADSDTGDTISAPYEKTEYAYEWHDSDADGTNDNWLPVASKKTTTGFVRYATYNSSTSAETFYLPDGTVDGSGGTKTLEQIAFFDTLSRLAWEKDAIGLIDYLEYDNDHLARRIKDVDTAQTSDFSDLPAGWSTNGTYGGLHKITDHLYDNLGRVTQVLGPEHKIDISGSLTAVRTASWRVYAEAGDAALDQRWTVDGYQKTSDSDNVVVGPIKAEFLCKLDRAMATVQLASAAFTDGDADDVPDIDELELVNEGAGDETKNWLACTTVSFDGDGELAWRKVFHSLPTDAPTNLNSWGSFGSASDYAKTDYEYDEFGRVTKKTDPESKDTFLFFDVASVSIDSATEVFFEQRVYPHVYNDGGYKLAGPISVTWTDADGDLVRQFLASATVTAATPTGLETLTELSRTSFTYDSYGRVDKTRKYFDLPANWDTGTEGTNFYELQNVAYDLRNRALRQEDGLGTFTAAVYDGLGRVVTQWVGTDATGATRTDPEGTGGNDLVKVSENFYDLDRDGTGTLVPYLTRSEALKPLTTLAGTSADYTGVDYKPFDGTDTLDSVKHLRGKVEPDVGADTATYFDGVARRRTLQFANGSTANSLAGTDAVPGPGDRIIEHWTADAQTGGALADRWGTRVETLYAYDEAGLLATTTTPTGAEAKFEYDAAGRNTRKYLVAGQYSSADLVIQEAEYTYDDVGNMTEEVLYRRDDGNTTAGGLLSGQGTSISQNSYIYRWYDDVHRVTNVVNYGVQASDPAPGSVPAFADARVRTDMAYNSVGRLLTATNNRQFVKKYYYDDLGRSTCVVENFVAAEFDTEPTGLNTPDLNSRDADECRTTTYSYNAAGQILTIVAMDPNADGTETDNQVTTYVYSDQLDSYTSPVNREDLLIGIIYPDSSNTVVSRAFSGTYDRMELEYNAAGLVAQRKDQRSVEMDISYDDFGKPMLQAVTLPGGSDVDDAVLSIEKAYDDMGRLTRVTSYDDDQGSAGSSNEVNEVVYEFNDWGQVATSWQEHAGAAVTSGGSQSPKVQYVYYSAADATYSYEAGEMDLRLEYVVYPNGRKVHYTYGANDSFADYLSRTDAIREDNGSGAPGNALAEYTFMGAGTLVKRTSPTTAITDGLELNFGAAANNYDGFDNLGRVVDLTWQDLGTPSTIHQFEYSYDRNGNPLAEDGYDDVWLPFSQTKIVDFSYTYDDLDRLTEARQGDMNGNSSIADADVDQIRKYTLDQLGNWTDFDIGHYDGGFVWDAEQGRTYTAGGANEIETLTGHGAETLSHDMAGNSDETVIGMQLGQSAPQLHEMIYDAWNRLVKVQPSGGGMAKGLYVYDGMGRKVRTLDVIGPPDFDHYYNTNWQMLETQLTLNPQPTLWQYVWCARYIDALLIRDEDDDLGGETDFGGGDLGMSGSGLETRMFYLQDASYSARYTLLDDATMGLSMDFSAYGDMALLWVWQGNLVASSMPGMWHGYEWDLATAMHHVRNRTFNIGTGRWLQRDPSGYGDGMGLYEYVQSRPIYSLDPTGLASIEVECPGTDGTKWTKESAMGTNTAADSVFVNEMGMFGIGYGSPGVDGLGAWDDPGSYGVRGTININYSWDKIDDVADWGCEVAADYTLRTEDVETVAESFEVSVQVEGIGATVTGKIEVSHTSTNTRTIRKLAKKCVKYRYIRYQEVANVSGTLTWQWSQIWGNSGTIMETVSDTVPTTRTEGYWCWRNCTPAPGGAP